MDLIQWKTVENGWIIQLKTITRHFYSPLEDFQPCWLFENIQQWRRELCERGGREGGALLIAEAKTKLSRRRLGCFVKLLIRNPAERCFNLISIQFVRRVWVQVVTWSALLTTWS